MKLLAFLLVGLWGQSAPPTGHLSFGSVRITNFILKSYGGDVDNGLSNFSGSGNPMKLEQQDQGVVLTSQFMSGVVQKQSDGSYLLNEGHATGKAFLVSDSDLANSYLKSIGKPTHAGPLNHIELTSEEIDYAQSGLNGVVTLPSAFHLTDAQSGTGISAAKDPKPYSFQSLSDVTGTSGNVSLALSTPNRPAHLSTGTVNGPMHYHYQRRELIRGEVKVTETEYDLTADHLEMDFTKPQGTITATGHVHITSSDPSIDTNADRAVLTTDENMKPVRFTADSDRAALTTIKNVGVGH